LRGDDEKKRRGDFFFFRRSLSFSIVREKSFDLCSKGFAPLNAFSFLFVVVFFLQ